MPRLPIDYSKAVIYKIVCNDFTIKECYYGSTTSFVKRKNCHKYSCNNKKDKEYNTHKYQFIRENGGWDNWKMILIKEFPCKNKLELEREERRVMEEDEFRINTNNPYITKEERKENQKKYDKEKASINYEKFNCDCGGRYTYKHKQNHFRTKIHLKYIKEQE